MWTPIELAKKDEKPIIGATFINNACYGVYICVWDKPEDYLSRRFDTGNPDEYDACFVECYINEDGNLVHQDEVSPTHFAAFSFPETSIKAEGAE